MNAVPVVRCAIAADLPAVMAIAESSRPWAPFYTPEFYGGVLQVQGGQPLERVLLVSAVAEAVTGFAVLAMLVAVSPVEAELESLGVAPAARRHGTGEALVRAAIACAAEAGTVRLELRSRNAPARRLYERCGFRTVGTRLGYYSGPVDDAVCMALDRTVSESRHVDAAARVS